MVAVSGDRGRPWRYLLEYDGSDRATAELAAAQGGDVDLLRVPDGAEFAAERLVPGAGWRRTDALTRERWRGAERWFFPVAHEHVVELLRRWSELGRLPEPVDVEPDVPADLEATLAAIDDRAAAGATLDPLPPQRAETVRVFASQHVETLQANKGVAFDIGYIDYFSKAQICDLAGLVNGRAAASLTSKQRLNACVATDADFFFLNSGQLSSIAEIKDIHDWQSCGQYDLVNVRSEDRHYLLVRPSLVARVCTATGQAAVPYSVIMPPQSATL